MQLKSRTIIIFIIFILWIVLSRLAWPWIHASYIWQESTIKSLESSTKVFNEIIPRIIHQTYRDNLSISYQWQQASNSCRILHPDYEYKFWSDIDGRRLIENEFPYLLPTFDSYPYDIQRADVIRLVVLYVYGGIYLDFDIICLKSLDQLLKYELILPRTKPVGLSNDIIISKAQHPFLLNVLENLVNANRNYLTKYPTVMFSTGPMYLTDQASKYFDRKSLDILSPELYGKYTSNSSVALFRHLKASSWHGNDVSIIKWIYQRRYFFIFMIICFNILLGIYFIQKNMIYFSSIIIEELDTMNTDTKMIKYREIYRVIYINILCLFLQIFQRFK